jgi:hypothetical protein
LRARARLASRGALRRLLEASLLEARLLIGRGFGEGGLLLISGLLGRGLLVGGRLAGLLVGSRPRLRRRLLVGRGLLIWLLVARLLVSGLLRLRRRLVAAGVIAP